MNANRFLPTTRRELDERGITTPDIILVTGDAYVDHPSYGSALIGRLLEDAGYTVGIIAQPDWRAAASFTVLGRPRLFFGVTAGNLDSMITNYTANKKPRSEDDYAPGGKARLRPDRASIIYTNKIREAFPGVTIVLGGIEASLRRLAHYDYWSDTVRRSILLDAKADILVYGMGERQILTIAERKSAAPSAAALTEIPGTVIVRNELTAPGERVMLPSFEETARDTKKFSEAMRLIYREADPLRGRMLVQRHADRFVLHYPPAAPLTTAELDHLYQLPYTRQWHPTYTRYGGIPGFAAVRHSVTSHRGCPGACTFCSLYLHQGRIVQSRSEESIIAEIERIAADPDFGGTITDIGGPTANVYQAVCPSWKGQGTCESKSCLTPAKCAHLKMGYDKTKKLWDAALRVSGVKHVFVGSGIRYDLLNDPAADNYLEALCRRHISGLLKIAPEHADETVLRLMNKPLFDQYTKFAVRFKRLNERIGKKQYLVNYIISGHPGSTLERTLKLSLELAERGIRPEQIQDFIPLPMTAAGAMYHTGTDPFTGMAVYVPKGERERKLHRALIQYWQPANRRYVIEALQRLKQTELAKKLLGAR